MPQVSVIVPVYNVEKYLERCIDSILAQTCNDFELILVDDGSPDKCGGICDNYSKKDHRISVIHQHNQGVSVARNVGISASKGEFIAFIDSDDFIHPQMIELTKYVLDHTDYPFVHCAFHRLYEGELDNSLSLTHTISVNQIQEIDSEQGMLKMMDWKRYGHYIVKGLYRKSYIKDIPFSVNTRWEDIIWSGEVVGKAGKYAYIPFDLYTYCMHEASLVHTMNWNTQKQYFKAFEQYLGISRQLTPKVQNKVELMVYQAFIERENQLFKSGNLDIAAQKEIECFAKACNINAYKIIRSDMNLRRKLTFLMCSINFRYGCRVRRKLIV